MLHGLGVSGAVWQPFARRLTPWYAAIAPDLRGHGASDHPASAEAYELTSYARDMAALVDATAAPPVPVVGHSLGSLVAVTLAATFPERVQALVLVDPPLDPARKNDEVPIVYRLRRAPAGELEAYLQRPGADVGAAIAAALASQFRAAADLAFKFLMDAPAGYPEVLALAPRVLQPTLIVAADPNAGGLLGESAAERARAAFPHAELASVPGASHSVHASRPRELAELTLSFLRQVAGASAR